MSREIVPRVLDVIRRFEGIADGDPTTVNLDPYLDPVGIWTIGYGHAIRAGGRFLRGEKDRARATALYPNGLTRAQAETLLAADALDTARDVEAIVPTTANDHQFGALVSFAFNAGASALATSTLLRKFKAGDAGGAAKEFERWVKAGNTTLLGLVRRRQAEAALFGAATSS